MNGPEPEEQSDKQEQGEAQESVRVPESIEQPGKHKLVCAQQFQSYDNMYKIVDFLNRNLRQYDLLFGLTKDQHTMTINIYEVEGNANLTDK